jgi:hypothetical protein
MVEEVRTERVPRWQVYLMLGICHRGHAHRRLCGQGFLVEWLWFGSVNYQAVYAKSWRQGGASP